MKHSPEHPISKPYLFTATSYRTKAHKLWEVEKLYFSLSVFPLFPLCPLFHICPHLFMTCFQCYCVSGCLTLIYTLVLILKKYCILLKWHMYYKIQSLKSVYSTVKVWFQCIRTQYFHLNEKWSCLLSIVTVHSVFVTLHMSYSGSFSVTALWSLMSTMKSDLMHLRHLLFNVSP